MGMGSAPLQFRFPWVMRVYEVSVWGERFCLSTPDGLLGHAPSGLSAWAAACKRCKYSAKVVNSTAKKVPAATASW